MANGTKFSDTMNTQRIERIKTIVRAPDAYKACPVPRQQEVQEFLVDGIAATQEAWTGVHDMLKTLQRKPGGGPAMKIKAFGYEGELSLAAVSEIVKHGGLLVVSIGLIWLLWTLNNPIAASSKPVQGEPKTMLQHIAKIAREKGQTP